MHEKRHHARRCKCNVQNRLQRTDRRLAQANRINVLADLTSDDLAREAARLIELGRAVDVADALRQVTEGLDEWTRSHVRRPSHGLVREHVRGYAMQSMGEQAYRESVRRVWRIAEDVMTLFEQYDPVLAGRTAKGQIDAGATAHIRLYTVEDIGELARLLVEHEYEEPAFDTINTRWGRLNRLRFQEQDVQVSVTRCRPDMRAEAGVNLHDGSRIEVLTLKQLRGRLA